MLTVWHTKYARYGLPQIPNPYEIVLFYRTDTFEPVEIGHWWLSPTPGRPSIGFGNVAPRVVLWAHLRHGATHRELLVLITHIDHRCTRPMVDLCRERIVDLAPRAPSLVFAGDFNFNPSDPEYHLLLDDGWHDSYEVAAPADAATFLYDLPTIPGGRIDHILYRGDGLKAQAWRRLVPSASDQRVSDHDPVYAHLSIEHTPSR